MRILGYPLSKVDPVLLIFAQETDEHARVQPREEHLAYPIAMEGPKFGCTAVTWCIRFGPSPPLAASNGCCRTPLAPCEHVC